MTIQDLRKTTPGMKVMWIRNGDEPTIGCVRAAGSQSKSARWIDWEDGQRTEDHDDWSLENVQLYVEPRPCQKCDGKGFLNPDGTPVNAFKGSDSDPVIACPDCQEPKP